MKNIATIKVLSDDTGKKKGGAPLPVQGVAINVSKMISPIHRHSFASPMHPNESFYSTFPKEEVYKNFKKRSPKIIKDLIDKTNLPINFLAEYIFEITPKTFTRYRRENIKLPSLFIELALKIIRLYNEGIEIFGSKEIFNDWITKENIGLGNKRPLDLLNTSTGVDMIYEELKRIEFGATA